jgi:hypothetical protein
VASTVAVSTDTGACSAGEADSSDPPHPESRRSGGRRPARRTVEMRFVRGRMVAEKG